MRNQETVRDIRRPQNEPLAEHWDALRRIEPEMKPANDNGQFSTQTAP